MKFELYGPLLGMAAVLVSIQSMAIEPVIGINTDTYAVTRNLMDVSGPDRIHEYKVGVDGQVYWRRGGEKPWTLFPKQPVDVFNSKWRVENLAADNNRIFVLARERTDSGEIVNSQLYWFCVYPDTAEWVEDLLGSVPENGPVRDVIDFVEGELGDPINEEAYLAWVIESHQGIENHEGVEVANGKWETIYQLPSEDEGTMLDYTRPRGNEPDLDTVIDLAVGHWNSTVVNYYVYGIDQYGQKQIYYIDEEPMMTKWGVISTKNHTYTIDEIQADPVGVLLEQFRTGRDILTVATGDGRWRNLEIPVRLVPFFYRERACMEKALDWRGKPNWWEFWKLPGWLAGPTQKFRLETIIYAFLENYHDGDCQYMMEPWEIPKVSEVIHDFVQGGIGNVHGIPHELPDAIRAAVRGDRAIPPELSDFISDFFDVLQDALSGDKTIVQLADFVLAKVGERVNIRSEIADGISDASEAIQELAGEDATIPSELADSVAELSAAMESAVQGGMTIPEDLADYIENGFGVDVNIPKQMDQNVALVAAASVFLNSFLNGQSGPEVPVKNPPPLIDCSRINASNSVVAVSVPDGDETAIYYIRFDYHHQPEFKLYPLMDWSEDVWNVVRLPGEIAEFGINTHGQYDPREYDPIHNPDGGGWWYVPPFQVYDKQIYLENKKGILGSYPSKMVATYPVSIATWGSKEDDTIDVITSRTPSEFYPVQAPDSEEPLVVTTPSGAHPLELVNASHLTIDLTRGLVPRTNLWRYYQGGPYRQDKGVKGDLLFVEPANYSIHVAFSTGSGFVGNANPWIGPSGFGNIMENYFAADFNGDGLTDLGYLGGDDGFYVTTSTGSSFGGPGSDMWISPVPVEGHPEKGPWGHNGGKLHTGDFNGDGMADLLFVEPSNYSIHVNFSTGTGFGGPGGGEWIEGWHFGSILENYFTADFNGDGLTDLGYLGGDNSFHVTISTGSSFGGPGSDMWISPVPVEGHPEKGPWGHINGKHYTGDFNGDGRDDLMFFEPGVMFGFEPTEQNDGRHSIHVALSTGSGFIGSPEPWIWPNGFGSIKENYFVGDFNADGAMDIGYLGANHGFYVALSTGTHFYGPGSGEWIPPGGRHFGGTWGKYLVGAFTDASINLHRPELSCEPGIHPAPPPRSCISDWDCVTGVCRDGECVAGGGDDLVAAFRVTTDWGTGYCVALDVINRVGIDTTSWSVTYDVGSDIVYDSWNADFSDSTGQITATPVSWNNVIAPDDPSDRVQVGFCVNRNGGAGLPTVIDASGTY